MRLLITIALVCTILVLLSTTITVTARIPASIRHHRLPTSLAEHHHRQRKLSAGIHPDDASSQPHYQYQWEVKYFQQPHIDHFNFNSTASANDGFTMRYLYNDQYWTKPRFANDTNVGPIFFYTGNEGSIDLFANNTGLIFESCPEFNCLIIFAEHRYYGTTMPLGPGSLLSPGALQYLTAEQALADYAVFLSMQMYAWNATAAKVIAFGGSYGGMLTAYMRIKYPHIITGGIAGSAPIRQFQGLVDPELFSAVIADDYNGADPECGAGIGNSWNSMLSLASQNNYAALNRIFSSCPSFQLKSVADITGTLYGYVSNALSSTAMADYPSPATFLGAMPAWPVNYQCKVAKFQSGQTDIERLESLNRLTQVFYNYSGEAGACNDLTGNSIPSLGDPTPWTYQACTEMILPIAQSGLPKDILYPAPWDLNAALAQCATGWNGKPYNQYPSSFGVSGRPYWIPVHYGGADYNSLQYASNIVFSNGLLDVWHTGGILHNVSDSVVAIIIAQGAHHVDLRGSTPYDPPSVTQARITERAYIRAWINGYPNPQAQAAAADNANQLAIHWIVIISVGTTLAVVILSTLLFRYCKNSRERSVGDVQYRTM